MGRFTGLLTALVTSFLLCPPWGQTLGKCVLMNHTLYVEREGCDRCMAVNTTMCAGYCFSRDPNLKSLKTFRVQRACVYHSLVYRTVTLPGCLPNVDPLFTFPVARRCSCGRCNTSNTWCLRKHKRLPDQCNPLPSIDPAQSGWGNSTARNITDPNVSCGRCNTSNTWCLHKDKRLPDQFNPLPSIDPAQSGWGNSTARNITDPNVSCGRCNTSNTWCLHKDKRLPDQFNPLPSIDPAQSGWGNSTARNITDPNVSCGRCNTSNTWCLHKDKRLPDQFNPLPSIDPAQSGWGNSTARNITEESQNG